MWHFASVGSGFFGCFILLYWCFEIGTWIPLLVWRTTMSDDGDRTCPLCAEEMDLTDQQLKPCKCGYEVRMPADQETRGNWVLIFRHMFVFWWIYAIEFATMSREDVHIQIKFWNWGIWFPFYEFLETEFHVWKSLWPLSCPQICVWCWHQINDMAEKEETEGRCPACRTPYDKERIVRMAANCKRSFI